MVCDNRGVSFTFNKGSKMNITKFDGASKEELLKKAEKNKTQTALINALFAKYDDGDGIMTADEYQNLQQSLLSFTKDDNLGNCELKRFNKKELNVGKKDYSMADLQAVIGMMTDGSDNITGVKQLEGGKLEITYKPEADGTARTAQFNQNDDKTLTLLSDTVTKDNKTTTTEYAEDGKTPTKETVTEGTKTTTTTYTDGGKTEVITDNSDNLTTTIEYTKQDNSYQISSKKTVKGSETTEYDPKTDKPTKKITDKGNGGTETVEYTYTDNGSTETTYTTDKNKPSKVVEKDVQGNPTKTTEYESNVDGTTTETITTGTGDSAVRTQTTKNAQGKLTGFVNVDEQGNVQDYTHTVQPGDTWYGIVQAKYGITDHKQTMEIVAQLKKNANVNSNATNIPKEITLPAKVTLKDGTEVVLKNTGALVNMSHNVDNAPRITPPKNIAANDLPQNITPLSEAEQSVNINDVANYPVLTAQAGKTVKGSDLTNSNPDGKTQFETDKYYRFDSNGRVINIYENYDAVCVRNNSVWIKYDDKGQVEAYQKNTYDERGNYTGGIEYDDKGKFLSRFISSGYTDNASNSNQYTRQVIYDKDGNMLYFLDNYKYDEQGQRISYDKFTMNGKWLYSRRMDYGNDGTRQTRHYFYDDNGKMTSSWINKS